MKKIISILLISLAVITVNAQAKINTKERVQNRNQIEKGKQELARDVQELADFKISLEELDNALQNKQFKKANLIKNKLVTDMEREVMQSKAKLKKDSREVSQSKAEVRTENREVRADRRDLRSPQKGERRELARDRQNRRDDSRDLRDDKRDFAIQNSLVERQKEILAILKVYNFTSDKNSKEKAETNKALVYAFVKTMEEDIRLTKKELSEDHRESAEDRMERRDDRRN